MNQEMQTLRAIAAAENAMARTSLENKDLIKTMRHINRVDQLIQKMQIAELHQRRGGDHEKQTY